MKLRPIFKTHGGKHYLCKDIIHLLPYHKIYIEPYAGGLSVLLNKPICQLEIANDINPGIIAVYEALLNKQIDCTNVNYDLETFNTHYKRSDPLSYLIKNRFSRGGLGKTFAYSDRLRGGQPGDINAWETLKLELPYIIDRLKDVKFYCSEALEIIKQYDAPNVLMYLDPPYPHWLRTTTDVYYHEMSIEEHKRLVNVLKGCKSNIFLSSYRNHIYDELDWWRVDFHLVNHSGQGKTKQKRIESLYINIKD